MIAHRGRGSGGIRVLSLFTGMVGSRPANWLALLVMLPQLVDASRDVLDAVLQDLFGDLFLIEDDNFLDRERYAALQVLTNGQERVVVQRLIRIARKLRKPRRRTRLCLLLALFSLDCHSEV